MEEPINLTYSELKARNTKLLVRVLFDKLISSEYNNASKITATVEKGVKDNVITIEKFEFFLRVYVSQDIKYMLRLNTVNCREITKPITYYRHSPGIDRDWLVRSVDDDFTTFLQRLLLVDYSESCIYRGIEPKELLKPMRFRKYKDGDIFEI